MNKIINLYLILILVSSLLLISGCNKTTANVPLNNDLDIQEEIPLKNIIETGSIVDTQETAPKPLENTANSNTTKTDTNTSTTTSSTTSTTTTTIADACVSLGCPEGTKYVGSSKSDKYHYCSCSYAKKIYPENRLCFKSKEDAQSQGYVPCGVCKP